METHVQKEHWLTVYNWLKQCGSGPNQHYCREEITTHPDYPSLLSVVDFLDGGGMAYQAVRADASYINEFNYPLLAHIKEPGNEYMHIVQSAAAWGQQKELTQHWTGIALYPEKDAVWQSGENDRYQRTAKRNKFIAVALTMVGIAIFSYASYRGLHFTTSGNGGGIWDFLFGILSLSGLTVSLFALGTELGFQSQVVKQVCGAVGGNGGCETVLKSRYAKGVWGITPADASVLYFASQFVMYLISCWQPSFFPFILWLSLGGILVAVWSIYTQAAKLKQWCALCLGIVAVLVLQAAMSSFVIKSIVISGLSLRDWALAQQSNLLWAASLFAVLFALLTLILSPIKQLIKTNTANKQKLAELKKWKLDADLFISQWQQEQEVDTTVWENDLLLGDPNAPIMIIVACSASCQPCAKAHKQLDEMLLLFNGKLKVLVRFLENERTTKSIKGILQVALEIKTSTELEKAISNWFEWMDYDKWVENWQPDTGLNVDCNLKLHKDWAEKSKIAFTPTFFLNDKKMPGRYGLDDIGWLIPQLAEKITSESII